MPRHGVQWPPPPPARHRADGDGVWGEASQLARWWSGAAGGEDWEVAFERGWKEKGEENRGTKGGYGIGAG